MMQPIDPTQSVLDTILDEIERRRKTTGMTRKEMLEQADLSSSALSPMKRGTPPNLLTLLKIAQVLDVPVATFFGTPSGPNKIDFALLATAIKRVESNFAQRRRVATFHARAVAIGTLYEELIFFNYGEFDPELNSARGPSRSE